MQKTKGTTALFANSFSALVWGIAAVKTAFLLSFFVVLAQGSATLAQISNAQGDEQPPIVCTGKNLLDDLKTSNPEALAKIVNAGLAVANGNARFWKIEKPGLAPSWLLGTMHFADPRVVTFPSEMESAFKNSKIVVIENLQVLDPQAMAKAMAELRPIMFFSDGTTLEKYYGSDMIEVLKARLKDRPIPYFLAKRMQPWVLASAVVMPICEIERKQRNQKVLDLTIGLRAREEGKQLVGLESVKEQLSAMAGLPLEFHLNSLKETVKLGDKVDDMMETMVVLYQSGKIGQFWPLMESLSPKTTKSPGYAEFQEALITRRNETMFVRSKSQFKKGGVFMAVGALHLPGDLGVLRKLQNAGYKISPVL